MSGATGIDYLTKNWTVITGCSPISEGCANCYAKKAHDMRHKAFLAGKKMPKQYAEPFEAIQFHKDRLDWPLSWRDPQRVGVCFTGDWMLGTREQIDAMLETVSACKRHTFFTLTKRADMLDSMIYEPTAAHPCRELGGGDYLLNLYNGITAENQARLDERAPELVKSPGKHWLSLEPLLGSVGLTHVPWPHGGHENILRSDVSEWARRAGIDRLNGIDWVVVGCESGPNRRPCKLEWIEDIVQQCKAAGVPCYVKQAPVPTGLHRTLLNLSRHMPTWDQQIDRFGWRVSHDPNEWPESIRVRQFPGEHND